MATIHPTAVVAAEAVLGESVTIGPYAVIEGPVEIGRGTVVGPFVHLMGRTKIGEECVLRTGAVVGSPPQDLKYKGEQSFLTVGNRNVIREYVTVNPGTGEGQATVIGDDNLIMAYSHVAHNCAIGSRVVMANAATLAGHVVIEDFVVVGGLTGVHQFCRIGRHSIIGGCSKVVMDIIPYVTADGRPAVPSGLNLVGLRRRGFTREAIDELQTAYRLLFRSGNNTSAALESLRILPPREEVSLVIAFIEKAERGIARP